MKIFIPTLTVEKVQEISKELEKEFNYKNENQESKVKKHLLKLWYFIYEKQIRKQKVKDLTYFVNISNKELDNFKLAINKKRKSYKFFINKLEEFNLIEINHKYSNKNESNFCKSYKIRTDFIGELLEEIEIDLKLIFKDYKTKEYYLRKYPNLRTQIKNIYNTNINLTQYQRYLQKNKGIELKSTLDKTGKIKRRFLDNERIFRYLNDALKITFKNIWIKQSDEGRLYTSFTNLSSTALDFLTVNDKKVKEVDVTNCFPLILSKLIKNERYKADVENGIFYENLCKIMNKDRHLVKHMVFRYALFSNNNLLSGELYDAFEKLYPNMINKINEYKKKHGNISKQLQKIESDIFVTLDYKDTMLRHDAIFVEENRIEEVEKEIVKRFQKIGLKVQLN